MSTTQLPGWITSPGAPRSSDSILSCPKTAQPPPAPAHNPLDTTSPPISEFTSSLGTVPISSFHSWLLTGLLGSNKT